MTIPKQLSLGEVIGQKKGKYQPIPRPVSPGRPRRELDVELLRKLRGMGYGYKRIAGEYTRATGEYISHTTVRERLTILNLLGIQLERSNREKIISVVS
jgi:hypothetical protein